MPGPEFPAPGAPGLSLEEAVHRASASSASLLEAAENLLATAPLAEVTAAAARQLFRPAEEEALIDWFARFLTVRDGLWEVLSELVGAHDDGEIDRFFEPGEQSWWQDELLWRTFVLGYGATCAIVRLDRYLLETLATDSVTQRKLNQGDAERRIPRKRFTVIFESFTDPQTALVLDQAIETRQRHRDLFRDSASDPLLAPTLARLPWLEHALDRSKRRFLRLLVRYQRHALLRRLATLREHGFFQAAESSGRVISEIQDRWQPKRVSDEVRGRLEALLRPGDVLITRHERALTNLFLPGFWPHAALYTGTERDRRRLGVELDALRRARWSGTRRTLEALKDGVRFRPLEETLAVDAVAALRPRLSPEAIAVGLARAAGHEGKGYNFDFDFFRSDRLVCTEVIYRAYDGLENFEIPLQERAGRPTLSAEDLLDLAFEDGGRLFEVVAVFGAPGAPDLVVGEDAREPLRASYRDPA